MCKKKKKLKSVKDDGMKTDTGKTDCIFKIWRWSPLDTSSIVYEYLGILNLEWVEKQGLNFAFFLCICLNTELSFLSKVI